MSKFLYNDLDLDPLIKHNIYEERFYNQLI